MREPEGMDSRGSFADQVRSKTETKLPWLLDLSLWYAGRSRHESLPADQEAAARLDVAAQLGVPAWITLKPWQVSYEGVQRSVDESHDKRVVRYAVGERTLSAVWTMGPDGDWWQVEHLIKTSSDLGVALELARARNYTMRREVLDGYIAVSKDAVLAIELPRRPFSDLLHDFLGWGEGLLMLRDFESGVGELNRVLDAKLQSLTSDLASLPVSVFLSPDNLDGQYISPETFDRYLRPSYARSSQVLRASGKLMVVHAGGPIKQLLGPLADSGIDAVEGVSGPPQSDVPLPAARQAAGATLTLWGGIPQDWLLETTPLEEFESGVQEVIEQASVDGNVVLGVADRVPVGASTERLQSLSKLIQ